MSTIAVGGAFNRWHLLGDAAAFVPSAGEPAHLPDLGLAWSVVDGKECLTGAGGRYTRGERLGKGMSGTVTRWVAPPGRGPDIALKVMSKVPLSASVVAELAFLRASQHPSCGCDLLNGIIVADTPTNAAIAMEVAHDLVSLRLSWRTVALIAELVLQDMVCIRETTGFVCCDFKPDNCLYIATRDRVRVVLGDFGGFALEGSFATAWTWFFLHPSSLRAYGGETRRRVVASQQVTLYALGAFIIDLCAHSGEMRDILDETAEHNRDNEDDTIDPFVALRDLALEDPHFQTPVYKLAFTLMGFLDGDVHKKDWVRRLRPIKPTVRLSFESALLLFGKL